MEGLNEFLKLIFGFFVAIGATAIGIAIIFIIVAIVNIIGGIILLCFSIREKNKLQLNGISRSIINEIIILSICSLFTAVCSFFFVAPYLPFGLTIILPLIALIYSCVMERPDEKLGNIVNVTKKAHFNITLLIISNSFTVGSILLGPIYSFFYEAINNMINL